MTNSKRYSSLLKVLSEKAIDVLRKIQERKVAFAGEGRQNKIVRIVRMQQIQRIKRQIGSLRKNMSFLKNNEDSQKVVDLLKSIDLLNKKLQKVQKAATDLK